MNLYHLNLFVHFTCKILRRSRALWVCALLSFCCVNFFQIYFQSNFVSNAFSGGFVANLRALAFPELIPYMNVYLFSVLQTIVLLFFSVGFLNKGLKKDSMDVIYYRPESNVEYVWGTILGFILIFGGAGLISLLCGVFVHLMWSEAPFMIGYYFFYYFTLFIPGLLCWFGISFCVTFLFRGRGIGVIFLLILFFVTTFYVGNYHGGIFDILGIGLSNVFSQVAGHTDMKLYLLQRGCWLLLGIGLLQGSVMLFGRLPNNPVKTGRSVATWVCLGGGCLLGLIFFHEHREIYLKSRAYFNTYAKFASVPKVAEITHDITFRQKNNRMEAVSDILLQNQGNEVLHEVIFYLNPTLEVESIKWNNEEINFDREYQVIRVKKQMQLDDTVRVVMKYQGRIDENVCYLDISDFQIQNMDKHIACPMGKRYAFLENDYTLLLPEVLWYPVTEPPVNTLSPNCVSKNFTCYSLKLLGMTDKVVISQGEQIRCDEYTLFRNSYPLIGISLCIGDYEVRSVRVDSVLYELYLLKGKYIPKSTDICEPYGTLMPEFLSEMKVFCEKKAGRKYPYNYFRMIESPVMFTSYYRAHKRGTEFVQPEILFLKERGNNSFTEKKAFLSSEFLHLNLELLLCSDYQDKDAFTWKSLFDNQVNSFNAVFKNINTEPNFYNIVSMFYWQVYAIHSEDYPELEMIFSLLMKYFEDTRDNPIIISQAGRVEFEALDYLQKHNLEYAATDKALNPEILNQIFDIKASELLNRLVAEGIPEVCLRDFILTTIKKYHFERIEYEDINQAFLDEFGIELSDILSVWYKNAGVPNYIVEGFDIQRIGEENSHCAPLARVYFSVFNNSDVDGFVNVQSSNVPFTPDIVTVKSYETKPANLCFRIPAKTGKQVSLLLPDSPEYYALKLNICGNIPNSIYTKLNGYTGVLDTLQYIKEFDRTHIQTDTNEIIVDNEDSGFQIINSGAYHRLLEKEEQGRINKYENMTRWLIPDDHWRFFMDYNAHGRFVRSAVIRNSGRGKTCVEWGVSLRREGRYEVFAYLPKFTYFNVLTKNRNPDVKTLSFTYTVSFADGENEITIQVKPENEWVSLGNYYFVPGEYRVELSDKGEAGYSIVADAVKWVYVGQRETK